jgi:hypothetical protein
MERQKSAQASQTDNEKQDLQSVEVKQSKDINPLRVTIQP